MIVIHPYTTAEVLVVITMQCWGFCGGSHFCYKDGIATISPCNKGDTELYILI